MTRLRRSLHFVPGANERMFAKALTLPADSLVLDLEDAVTPDRKVEAREVVAGWLRSDFGGRERVVRINALDTEWCREDIERIAAEAPDALMVPKAESGNDLAAVGERIEAVERARGLPPGGIGLIPVATETPRALLRIEELADAPRVCALTWGAEDLSAALGASANRDAHGAYLDVFAHARRMCLLAACAAGVQPIDGVYADVGDLAGLEREAREAAAMGFTGKMSLHPGQIDVIHRAMTPSDEVVADARALLAEFERERAQGRMAFRWHGQMVDAPHLERARRIVERAERAAGTTAD